MHAGSSKTTQTIFVAIAAVLVAAGLILAG